MARLLVVTLVTAALRSQVTSGYQYISPCSCNDNLLSPVEPSRTTYTTPQICLCESDYPLSIHTNKYLRSTESTTETIPSSSVGVLQQIIPTISQTALPHHAPSPSITPVIDKKFKSKYTSHIMTIPKKYSSSSSTVPTPNSYTPSKTPTLPSLPTTSNNDFVTPLPYSPTPSKPLYYKQKVSLTASCPATVFYSATTPYSDSHAVKYYVVPTPSSSPAIPTSKSSEILSSSAMGRNNPLATCTSDTLYSVIPKAPPVAVYSSASNSIYSPPSTVSASSFYAPTTNMNNAVLNLTTDLSNPPIISTGPSCQFSSGPIDNTNSLLSANADSTSSLNTVIHSQPLNSIPPYSIPTIVDDQMEQKLPSPVSIADFTPTVNIEPNHAISSILQPKASTNDSNSSNSGSISYVLSDSSNSPMVSYNFTTIDPSMVTLESQTLTPTVEHVHIPPPSFPSTNTSASSSIPDKTFPSSPTSFFTPGSLDTLPHNALSTSSSISKLSQDVPNAQLSSLQLPTTSSFAFTPNLIHTSTPSLNSPPAVNVPPSSSATESSTTLLPNQDLASPGTTIATSVNPKAATFTSIASLLGSSKLKEVLPSSSLEAENKDCSVPLPPVLV